MSKKECVSLRMHEETAGDTAYIELRDHPHEIIAGIVSKTVTLSEVYKYDTGPMINIDFDEEGRPIGIEVLYFDGGATDLHKNS